MLLISNDFNEHKDNNKYVNEWYNGKEYEGELYTKKEYYEEENYTEIYMMYDNDTRTHFLEHESHNQYTELWLMSKEDKINENDIYYIHNLNLNSKKILNGKNDYIKLYLEKDRYNNNIFCIYCEKVYIERNLCDICGDRCNNMKYCRGKLYDEEYEYEYELCDLFTSYIESLLFFKILCQTINPNKIKEKKYDFRINKLLILKLCKKFSKIDSYNLIDIISYL